MGERARALSKDQIRDRLWRGVVVSETGLARVVNEVRAALGDDARQPRFVRTLHGFGYVFVDQGAAEPSRRTSRCRLVCGRRRVPLQEGENVLGRAPDVAVTIDSTRASRRHARIVIAGDRVTLEDLGSKNGTLLNGRRIEIPTEIRDGDTVGVGPVAMVFEWTTTNLDTTETS